MPTEHLQSVFHTPSEFARSAFLHVMRAGHLKAAPDYLVDRRFFAGHDLIYCVAGRGQVRIEGLEFQVEAGQVLWIDGRFAHTHWADPDAPWEVLWMRADGFALARSAETLQVHHQPVFATGHGAAAVFGRVLDHLRDQPLALDALLHADVSALLAALFEERRSADSHYAGDAGGNPNLKLVLEKMEIYFYRRWTVSELAAMAKMSEANFYRSFHAATGSSPISWLRRHRVNHAKRRLVETTDSIKQIAEQVGYADPFYFSRDFRLACGLSPKHYREQETSPQAGKERRSPAAHSERG